MCCPENALTGAPAQFEGLIAVPFAHVLRRAFVWYISTDSGGADTFNLHKATVGGTFAIVADGSVKKVVGNTAVNVLEILTLTKAGTTIGQEEESSDLGALYRMNLDIVIGTDIFNNVGFGIMVSSIPPGPFEHRQ